MCSMEVRIPRNVNSHCKSADADKVSMDSERAEQLLKAAREATVHSGNITTWSKLRRKGVLTTTDELVHAVEGALKSWMGRRREVEDAELSSNPLISNTALAQRVEPSDRPNYLFTVKVYIARWDGALIHTAVETTLHELGISCADMVILAFPPCPEDQLTLDRLKLPWQHMEQLTRDKLTPTIGTADLLRPQMGELYEWATVKPKVNQVNLAHCCTMPEDLVAFSKEKGINLYTHNDDRDILPLPQLHSVLSSPSPPLLHADEASQWRHAWVTRYSSIVRGRGIIAHKGYLVGLEKE